MQLLGLEDEIADAPTEEDVEEPPYEIWPENQKALNLFMSLQNHWNFLATQDGEIVRTGIDLAALELKLKYTNGIAKKDYAHYFEQMAWMERAALAVMNKARSERIKERIEKLEKIKGKNG